MNENTFHTYVKNLKIADKEMMRAESMAEKSIILGYLCRKIQTGLWNFAGKMVLIYMMKKAE